MAKRTVQVIVGAPSLDGMAPLSEGTTVTFTPTRYMLVGTAIMVAEPVRVPAGQSVELEVTPAGWAYEVLISTPSGRHGPLVVVVDAGQAIALRDLPVVDPKTLDVVDPGPAWWAVADGIVAARDTAVAAAGAALESQAQAAQSAGAAAGSATTASTKASQASTSAADASTSASTATTKAGEASASATNAAGSSTSADQSRAAAQTARDQALAQTFGGVDLGTLDLNTVTTPGVYRQGTQANSTAARNYPTDAVNNWIVEVRRASSGNTALLQAATPTGGSGLSRARVIYIRRTADAGATWGAWLPWASQRVDKTVGLTIRTWDDIDTREQLIYGDTGWRDISASLTNSWTGTALIRRIGYEVYMRLQLDSTNATSTTVFAGPGSGFRPYTGGNVSVGVRAQDGTVTWGQVTNASASLFLTTGKPLQAVFTEVSYSTTDAWPTALPGTAVGTIPNV